ncbi:hypothetical protein CFP56_006992 [Quercus suber]|uniref:Uncharacterized protein n=1 Tax=Quercus suber TaxID=58331 RepID=A0AAW0L8K9_QUESU
MTGKRSRLIKYPKDGVNHYKVIYRPSDIWHFLTLSYIFSRGRILSTIHR